MKKYFFLFLFFFKTTFSFSQINDSSIISYFIKNKLLSTVQLGDYKKLQIEFKNSIIKSIEAIKDSAEKKRMLKRLENEIFTFPFGDSESDDTLSQLKKYHIIGVRQTIRMPGTYFIGDTTINKINVTPLYLNELAGFLNQLKLLGFTTPKTYKKVLAAINNKDVLDTFFIISTLNDAKIEEEYFSISRILPFLNKLKNLDILSENNYTFLRDLSARGDLEDILTIFVKCNKSVVIDLNEYGDVPETYMKLVHKKVSTIMPQLDFSDFNVTIQKNKEKSDTGYSYKTICSFINSSKKYVQENFYSPADYDKNNKPDNEWKLGDNFYNIFNKVLRDKQSDYRVHVINFHGDYRQRASGKAGLIALQKNQIDSLTKSKFFGYFDLSYEKFNNGLNSDKIQEAITLYNAAGLFKHLSKREIDSCINALNAKEINYHSDILSSFKNLVFEIDLEYGVDNGQYKEITKQIASISKGNFNPVFILDNYNYEKRKSFNYGFRLNKKNYKTRLKQEDDWLDTNFWTLITRAVKEEDKLGKFHDIYPSDGMRIIYLTNEQYQVLKNKKMIELEYTDIEQ